MPIAWVTGAKGFIGMFLCLYLFKKGYRVLGLGHGAWPLELASQFGLSYWVNGEIDDSNLSQLLNYSGVPEVIYHLAGGSSVGLSMQVPNEDFRRTVVSTANLLEWIRLHASKSKLLLISSAAVYGNSLTTPIKEEGLYVPYSPYGFHKKSSELLCESYSKSFGLKIGIVRLFSIYGPGLRKQFLWDLSCRLMLNPDNLEFNGSGMESRDWLYVEDAVRLLSTVAENVSDVFLIVNGGTGISTSIRDVVDLFCKALDINPTVQFSGIQRPGDPQSLVADIGRITSFGFSPQYNLDVGVRKYIDWYKSFYHDTSPRIT
jgi:UDP-glucose 4-epimerase